MTHRFWHPLGFVDVKAYSLTAACLILARHSWNAKCPPWEYIGIVPEIYGEVTK